MKRKITGILFILLFLVGFGDQWNTYRQSRLISSYEAKVSEMEPEDFTEEWEKAEQFNSGLVRNNIYGDAFGSDDGNLENTGYWQVLNVNGDGVMGYLSIPKIDVKLPFITEPGMKCSRPEPDI